MGSNPPANSSLTKFARCRHYMNSVSRGKKSECRRKEKEGGGEDRKASSHFSLAPSLPVWFLPVFFFCSLLFCCSKLTGTGFTGGTASYLIWLSFSPFPHFCLCVVPIHPRSILGGNFCVNYKESRGERSEATFLSLFFFPSLSAHDLPSFSSYPSCRSCLFGRLNLGKTRGGGSLCLMIMIIGYPAWGQQWTLNLP